MLEPVELQPGVVAFDDERLDRRAALRAIERRPDDDQLRALAGGDVDLLAVEDLLVAVEPAVVRIAAESEPASGSVIAIAAQRPSNRPSAPAGDGGDRRVAEPLARHRQQQADVAPAELDHPEHAGACSRRCGCRRLARARCLRAARPCGAGAAAVRRPRSCRRSSRRACRAPWVRVLGEVVLARVRAEDLAGDLVGLGDERRELLGVSRSIMASSEL